MFFGRYKKSLNNGAGGFETSILAGDGGGTQHVKKSYRSLPPGHQYTGVDRPGGQAAKRRVRQAEALLRERARQWVAYMGDEPE